MIIRISPQAYDALRRVARYGLSDEAVRLPNGDWHVELDETTFDRVRGIQTKHGLPSFSDTILFMAQKEHKQ